MKAAHLVADLPIKKVEDVWTDDYIGTAEALVAAGLARVDQFPGQPGRGATMSTYSADGSPVRKGQSKPPGMQIRRWGKSRFRVSVRVDEEVGQRRLVAYEASRLVAYEARRLERIERNSVTRLREGQWVRICAGGESSVHLEGRLGRILERATDCAVIERFEGMPAWRVLLRPTPDSPPDKSPVVVALEIGLEPIKHLQLVPGGCPGATARQPAPRKPPTSLHLV